MSILVMRTAIVERLRAVLDLDDAYISAHRRAEFNSIDLDSALKNTSLALRVAFAGVPGDAAWGSDEVDAQLAWIIYVAAKDLPSTPSTPRDELVLGVLPDLLAVVAHSDWAVEDEDSEGLCFRGKAEQVHTGPLYEGEVDGKSACVWSVTWRQMLVLPAEVSDDIRAFTTLITKYDLAPKDGVIEAEDDINMVVSP